VLRIVAALTTRLRQRFALILPNGADPTARSEAQQALAIAERYLGTQYKWGGSTPATGFDSAGLVQYAYDQVGIRLPRTTYEQALVGSPVAFAELLPGDLVFFRDSSGYIHHVGMYASDDRFLHAPFAGDVVKYDSLSEPYYRQQFDTGRRVAD
jgi:cell wall-associated NlpC family hydrolase